MNCHCGHARLAHDERGCCMIHCKCKLGHDYTGKRVNREGSPWERRQL